MSNKLFFVVAVCLVYGNYAQQTEDDSNEQADDPSSDWVLPGSTSNTVKVKTTTQVKVLSSRTILPVSRWSTIPVGEVLLVRNWPCKVIGSVSRPGFDAGQDNLETDAPESTSDVLSSPVATGTNVNVNINVDVTVLLLGSTRCLVQRRRNLIQRLSCISSRQCPDSGSVCKSFSSPIFGSSSVHDQSSLDYADPVSEAVDVDQVSGDPTDDSDDSSSETAPESAEDGDVLSDSIDDDAVDDWVNVQQSTSSYVVVKTNVEVKTFSSRRSVDPVVWPRLPIGEVIFVRNRPCTIMQQDAEDVDTMPEVQSDAINVNTDVKVNVGTVLALGKTRCQVEPHRRRITTRQGWCVCDSLKRFACRTDVECMQRWGSKGAGLRCIPTYACPVKGRTGYCRKPANQQLDDSVSG